MVSLPSIHEIARALNGRVYGDKVRFRTPGHSRQDQSSVAFIGAQYKKGYYLYTHSQKVDWKELDAHFRSMLNLPEWEPGGTKADLATSPETASAARPEKPTPFNDSSLVRQGFRRVAVYDYTDAGEVLYSKIRYEHASEKKKFLIGHRGPAGEHLSGTGTDRRVLYRGDYIPKEQPSRIFVCEGEKDCDRLVSLGLHAVSADNGSWKVEMICALAGHEIFVLEDNDVTGRKKAAEAAEALHGVAASVRVVRLPGLAEGKDVSDWLDAGHTHERLMEIALAAAPWALPDGGEQPAPKAEPKSARQFFDRGIPVSLERDRLEIAPERGAAPDFPLHAFPEAMRKAAEAVHHHMQAPTSLVAHSILSVASLLTQGHANVDHPVVGPRPMSLSMLVVAVSGERKSGVDDLVLHAVREYEQDRLRQYEAEETAYNTAFAAYRAEKTKIERDTKLTLDERLLKLRELREPTKPLIPKLRYKEPNLEGLVGALTEGVASIGIFTSEGGQFLGGHGMTDEARTRTSTGLSELWDEGSAERVRAKERTFVRGRRVAISLAVQPKIAASFLGDELMRDQGLIARFLCSYPESTIGQREILLSKATDDERLKPFYARCRELLSRRLPLRVGTRNELEPPLMVMSDEAMAVWHDAATKFERGCAPKGQWAPVAASALKMAENVLRIAGILEMFEHPDSVTPFGGMISGESMVSAVEIGKHYLREALRLVGCPGMEPKDRALVELEAWLLTEIGADNLVNPTMIQNFGPGCTRKGVPAVRGWIRELVEAGALELVGRATIKGANVREAYRVIGRNKGVDR